MTLARILVIGVVAVAMACTDDTGQNGTPTPGVDTSNVTSPDTTTTNPPSDTSITPPTDTTVAPKDTTLTPPDTGGPCPTTAGAKRMGAECTAHCECDTGYCYDEAFMGKTGNFRFCTRPCDFNCEYDDNDTGIQQYQCTVLGGKLEKHYGLTKPTICVLVCSKASDCARYSSKYDACGNTQSWTSWCYDDCSFCTSITGQGTCLVTSEMPDCKELQ